jgi:ActR/RegA family two-component response regulator
MTEMNTPQPIAGTLLVSNDAATIEQLQETMRNFAMLPELCDDVPTSLVLLNQSKFETVIVDLRLGGQVSSVVEKVRSSRSNRTAVVFTVSDSDSETAGAFKAGSNFVLRRPLSSTSISRSLKVAYGLILRERRRYFRCPVKIPVAICRRGLPEVQGETVNISENGMAVAASAALAPGVEVQMHFALPDRESRFMVEATICWCKTTFHLGLQFTTLSPRLTSELQEWLLQQLEQSLPQSLANQFRNLENVPH